MFELSTVNFELTFEVQTIDCILQLHGNEYDTLIHSVTNVIRYIVLMTNGLY